MRTEGIQDKYINPYADFGFKSAFRHGNEQGTFRGCRDS